MLSLKTRSSMEAALRSNLNPAIRHLIRQRMEQLGGFTDNDLDGLVEFNIVEPGDNRCILGHDAIEPEPCGRRRNKK